MFFQGVGPLELPLAAMFVSQPLKIDVCRELLMRHAGRRSTADSADFFKLKTLSSENKDECGLLSNIK